MRVSVNCSVTYSYEVDVPTEGVINLPYYADDHDPVYQNICKIIEKEGLSYDGVINSIVDEETEEVYYEN